MGGKTWGYRTGTSVFLFWPNLRAETKNSCRQKKKIACEVTVHAQGDRTQEDV